MTDGRRRVGITQRQLMLPERGETRDALDVRLSRLLWSLDLVPVPIPTITDDVGSFLAALCLDAVVLSGGDDPGMTPARDQLESVLLDLAEAHRLPLVGICRGMQQLVLRVGGALTPVPDHAATRHRVIGPVVGDRREVNSFHHHGVLPESVEFLDVTAMAPDGTVEAVAHPSLPWVGIMWHPEREAVPDPGDLALLRRVLGDGRGGPT